MANDYNFTGETKKDLLDKVSNWIDQARKDPSKKGISIEKIGQTGSDKLMFAVREEQTVGTVALKMANPDDKSE